MNTKGFRGLACFCTLFPLIAAADAFPLWQKWLRYTGGDTDETPVRTMMMGSHMQMSVPLDARPGDAERAQVILEAAREVLEHYRDVRTAEHDGYRAFAPSGKLGEEVHYTNYWRAGNEKKHLTLERPGSILYKRTEHGMVAVGVMYTAPPRSTPAELDERAPLSVATWHRHVDFCGWPKNAKPEDREGPGARFGFNGSLHSRETCEAAGGYWIPVALNWMTHVYPNEATAQKIWMGEHMMAAHEADAEAMHEESLQH